MIGRAHPVASLIFSAERPASAARTLQVVAYRAVWPALVHHSLRLASTAAAVVVEMGTMRPKICMAAWHPSPIFHTNSTINTIKASVISKHIYSSNTSISTNISSIMANYTRSQCVVWVVLAAPVPLELQPELGLESEEEEEEIQSRFGLETGRVSTVRSTTLRETSSA